MNANVGATTEPIGGQPSLGAVSSIKDFDYQIKYQRAFEAALWGLPAVAIYRFRAGAYEHLGYQDYSILLYSATATPRLEALTANSNTPYIGAYGDLRQGPLVVQVPTATAEGSLYGQVVDAWQFTIADIGPIGLDKGEGAKLLFTAPDFKGQVRAGYIQVASPNYRIAFAFRSIVPKGKTIADAYNFAKKLRVYPLSQAANPPEQKFIDPAAMRYPTLTMYDERMFEDLHAIFTVEPVRPQDKLMLGMLKTLGIERGKPFAPDETTRRAMRQAAVDVWFYIQSLYDNVPSARLSWPDRHYASLMQTDDNQTFTWEYDDRIETIRRACQYAWATYVPKVLNKTPATDYLCAIADKDGKPLQPGRLYKVTVPADMPVKQFWALTVYDRATFAFIYSESERTTLSSYDLGTMKKNTDGSVTIYVGPKPPSGLESNWIPTSGKRPLPTVRFYGPTEAYYNKIFKMPDFELVDSPRIGTYTVAPARPSASGKVYTA